MVVKATGGRLYNYNLCNTGPSSRFVRLYNSSAPVTGTTPVYAGPVVVAAGSCQQFATNLGLGFSAGISMVITAGMGDSDTTPTTVGDVTGFLGYE